MPPKAAKRKAKAAAGEDDDLWETPGNQPRKRPRTSESRIDEDSEGLVPKANKQFQSWAEWQKKFNDKEKDDKRHFAGTFKQNVEKNREAIQQLVSKSNESLNDAGKKYAELFNHFCAEARPVGKPISSSREGSPLFKAGQELFKNCRDLTAVHEQTNVKASAHGNTHTNERRALWKADMEQAQKTVVYGAQYGEKVIQCNVDMSSNDENRIRLLSPPHHVLSGPGQMALDMHQRSIEQLVKGKPTWGDEAVKYMAKLVGIATYCDV